MTFAARQEKPLTTIYMPRQEPEEPFIYLPRQEPEEPFIYLPRQEPEEPFIYLPRRKSEFPKKTPYEIYQGQKDIFNNFPQFIPMPYPVPMGGNQGNSQGGFNVGRAIGALAGAFGMGFGNPAFTPGPILSGRYSDLMKEANERINSGWTPGIIPEMPPGRYGGISDLLYRPDQDKAEVQLLGQMPRRIQGNYRPGGVLGTVPPGY